jgi:hypothetical protein
VTEASCDSLLVTANLLPLLIDTDAFCKLAIAGVIDETLGLLGSDRPHCARLPALPHMLRRGRLRKNLGDAICDSLVPIAESLPIVGQANSDWLDLLTPQSGIDPGEAQLFAVAAEKGITVLSGDKRAIQVLKNVSEFVEPLGSRIVVLEAALLSVCRVHGTNLVQTRIGPLKMHDTMVKTVFSPGNADIEAALESYLNHAAAEAAPIDLWRPPP